MRWHFQQPPWCVLYFPYFFTVKYGKILQFVTAALCLARFWLLFFFAGVSFPPFVWFLFREPPLHFPFCPTARVLESSSSASCFILARVFCLFFCCKIHIITPCLMIHDTSVNCDLTERNVKFWAPDIICVMYLYSVYSAYAYLDFVSDIIIIIIFNPRLKSTQGYYYYYYD